MFIVRTQKNNSTLRSIQRIFLKSVLTYDSQIKIMILRFFIVSNLEYQ